MSIYDDLLAELKGLRKDVQALTAAIEKRNIPTDTPATAVITNGEVAAVNWVEGSQ